MKELYGCYDLWAWTTGLLRYTLTHKHTLSLSVSTLLILWENISMIGMDVWTFFCSWMMLCVCVCVWVCVCVCVWKCVCVRVCVSSLGLSMREGKNKSFTLNHWLWKTEAKITAKIRRIWSINVNQPIDCTTFVCKSQLCIVMSWACFGQRHFSYSYYRCPTSDIAVYSRYNFLHL